MSEDDKVKKKRVCFDWCAIQTLFNKSQKKEVDLENLKNMFSLILTSENISEASVIPDQKKRFSNLNFCYDLFSENRQAFDNPTEILRMSYDAYRKNLVFHIPILPEYAFDFLNKPQNNKKNYIELQLESHKKINQNLREINDEIRNNPLFKKYRKENKNESLKNYLNEIFSRDIDLNLYFSFIKKQHGLEDDQNVLGAKFIKENDLWKLYLSAYLTGSFLCTYEQNKTTEPQAMDLRQIVYLPFCDYFVTNDKPFWEALQKLAESNFIELNTKYFMLNQFLTLIK